MFSSFYRNKDQLWIDEERDELLPPQELDEIIIHTSEEEHHRDEVGYLLETLFEMVIEPEEEQKPSDEIYDSLKMLFETPVQESSSILENAEFNNPPHDDVNSEIPPPLPSKERLIDEINACIDILKTAKQIALPKIKKQQHTYKLNTVSFMLLLSTCIATPVATLGLMIGWMNRLHAQLVSELQPRLASLLLILSNENAELKELNNEFDNTLEKIAGIDINQSLLNTLEKQWLKGFYQGKDSCESWLVNDQRVYLNQIFPNYNGEPCWFRHNDKTHPIQYCNELATKICDVFMPVDQLLDHIYEISDEITLKNSLIAQCVSEISTIKYQLHHKKPETTTTIIFALSAIVAMTLVFYIGYRLRKSHLAHRDTLQHAYELDSCLNSKEIERITKLVTRLGVKDNKNMTVEWLIDYLEKEAKAINLRRGAALMFFKGKFDSQATNHGLLTRDTNSIIFKQIIEITRSTP